MAKKRLDVLLVERGLINSREKAKALRESGIDPFGSRFDVTSDSKTIKEKYEELAFRWWMLFG